MSFAATRGAAIDFFRTGTAVALLKRAVGWKRRWPAPPSLGSPVIPRFVGMPEHRCFACSPTSSTGLKLKFHEAKGWALACSWVTSPSFENYPGMLHGGIAAAVLDEIIGQAIFHHCGYLPVSLTANVAWHKPVRIGEAVIAAARITGQHRRLYTAEAYLFRADGKVASSAKGQYYTPPLEQFRRMAELEQVPEAARAWFAPAVGRERK